MTNQLKAAKTEVEAWGCRIWLGTLPLTLFFGTMGNCKIWALSGEASLAQTQSMITVKLSDGGTTAADVAFHAFVWKRGFLTDLGTVGGSECSNAFGINSKTQVVGQSFDCVNPLLGQRAFVWQDGQIIDLNVFVPAGSGLMLNEVEEINDHGEIFGIGTLPNGDARAFLLIPVGDEDPEGITATPENLAALAAKTTQPANGMQGRKTQPEMLAAWRARLAQRYHIPVLRTPKD